MKKLIIALLLLWGTVIMPQIIMAEDCTCPCDCEPSPTPVDYSEKIILSEILANPSTSDSDFEFIELKNTDSADICLSDWQISDASGKIYKISVDDYSDTTIKAGGFFTVYSSVSSVSLNNSGDTVNLLQPNDMLLETVTYEEATEDYSYAKDTNHSWQWTNILTPNAENQFIAEAEKQPEYDFSDNIIISEIYADPLEGDQEFIELKNKNGEEVNLNGWKIADATDKKFIISSEKFISTKINKYFVIYGDVSKIALNNSGDSVRLYKPDDTLAQAVEYKDGKKGQSYSFADKKWQWTDKLTPDKENTIDTDATAPEEENNNYQFSDKLILSELLPDPEGSDSSDEFVEIFNSDNKNIDLLGWSLQDSSRTFTWAESVVLKPQEYRAFYITDTKISLNNLGEKISLLDPEEKIISTVTYGKSQTGLSYNYDSDEWAWSTIITPNEKNNIEEPASEDPDQKDEEYSLLNIQEAREQEKDTKAQVEGVVSVLPGILGSQYFYIQDNSGGLQVYSSQKLFPDNLKIGDLVKVKGKISEAYEEKKINISQASDIIIEDSDQEINIISVDTINEEQEGQLITTQSQILELASTKISLANGVIVYFKSSVNFNKSDWQEGDTIKVVGIASQYKDEYRLLPRSSEDLEKIAAIAVADNGIIKSASAQEEGNNYQLDQQNKDKTINYLLIIISLLVALTIYFISKNEKVKDFIKKIASRAAGGEKNTRVKDARSQYHG